MKDRLRIAPPRRADECRHVDIVDEDSDHVFGSAAAGFFEGLQDLVPEVPRPTYSEGCWNAVVLQWEQDDRMLTLTLRDDGVRYVQTSGYDDEQTDVEGVLPAGRRKHAAAVRKLLKWIDLKPQPEEPFDPDYAKAYAALNARGGCASKRIAALFVAERAAVWREVLAIAEREELRWIGSVDDGGLDSPDSKQTYAFARDVLCAATKGTRT